MSDKSPLHYAILNSQIETVQTILQDNREELYSLSTDGCLAIHYASWIGSIEIVKLCIEYAEIKYINSYSKVT